MAKLLKLRRGSTSQHSSFTGAEGEVTVDTDKDSLVVHDGSTAGGHPVAAEDMANVSAADIKGRLGTTLTNAEINGSAAIAGTKISPDFGSQNIVTTGTLGSDNITVAGSQPRIRLNDSGQNPDYSILNEDGVFGIYDDTNTAHRFKVNTDGHVDVTGNLDVGAGVDVTGNITTTSGSLTVDGVGSVEDSFKITDSAGTQYLLMGNQDSAGTNCPRIFSVGNAALNIGTGTDWSDSTGGTLTNQFSIGKTGPITSHLNHDFSAGIDVTGNITVTGTVDGVDIAALNSTVSGITTNATHTGEVTGATSLTIANNVVDEANLKVSNSPTNGYFLSAQSGNSGGLTWAQVSTDLSGDSSPQLGGTLQSNGHDIKFADSDLAIFGTGDDLKIFHSGGTNFINSVNGDLHLEHSNTAKAVLTGGAFRPASNGNIDLGTSSYKWQNIYTNDLHLSNEGSSNDVDGTWGNWTIQEGESDLFLKNNRSGKKYKFNLTEVS